MDYYSILGLSRGATDDQIKKAYRSLAMKHHPDRGGDEQKFKEIAQAYEVLSDPEKKRMVDSGVDPLNPQYGRHQESPFDFQFNSGNFEDLFGHFGFRPRQPRNQSIGIAVELTLEDVLTGKTIDAEIAVAQGSDKKLIHIDIPPGVEHGQQIRYQGMGSKTYPNAPAGDLIVSIVVRPHPVFKRDGSTIYVEKAISVWDAILGTILTVTTLDKTQLSITVPPGTQPETMLNCRGHGLPIPQKTQRGNLLVKIKVAIPKDLTPDQLARIRELKD